MRLPRWFQSEREISVQVDGMIPWIPAFDGLNVRVKWTPVEQGR
jgi:hypothetical protein